MAEVVQSVMEASNDRWHKIVETLQATQPPMHADGAGMKAKPHKSGGDPSDGSVDAWISLMRMYLEDCRGAERHRVLTLLTFLHKHAKAWIMQEPDDVRNSCDKIFTLLAKRSGIGESPNDAQLQFGTRKQEVKVRIKVAPGESVKTRNLEIMRNFMTGLLDHELPHSLHYTENPPTVEQIRSMCPDYLILGSVNSRRRVPGHHSTHGTKPNVPTNWTNPNTNQYWMYTSNTSQTPDTQFSQQNQVMQNPTNTQSGIAQKPGFVPKLQSIQAIIIVLLAVSWGLSRETVAVIARHFAEWDRYPRLNFVILMKLASSLLLHFGWLHFTVFIA